MESSCSKDPQRDQMTFIASLTTVLTLCTIQAAHKEHSTDKTVK